MASAAFISAYPELTDGFLAKVEAISARLGNNPGDLLALMDFETGGTFSPSKRNPTSGATGLIQFMPSTARALGTSTSALAQMSQLRQLDFVEAYLTPFAGRLGSIEDLYMAVLYPVAVGRPADAILFRSPSIEYAWNSGLDVNGDGAVTKREAASHVRARLRPTAPLQPAPPPAYSAAVADGITAPLAAGIAVGGFLIYLQHARARHAA